MCEAPLLAKVAMFYCKPIWAQQNSCNDKPQFLLQQSVSQLKLASGCSEEQLILPSALCAVLLERLCVFMYVCLYMCMCVRACVCVAERVHTPKSLSDRLIGVSGCLSH